MRKRAQAILFVLIVIVIGLIVVEYNEQFNQKYAAYEKETQILNARIDLTQSKINELKTKVYVVKDELSLQQETTDQTNFQFYVKNKELFEGMSDEE